MAEPAKTTQPPQGTKAPDGTGASRPVEKATLAPDGSFHLNVPREAVRSVEIADVDLLVRFSDGRNQLIPNGALDALSGTPPKISFQNGQSTAADLFKLAGKTHTVTSGNVRVVTDQIDIRNAQANNREDMVERFIDQPAPAPAPAPASASAKSTPVPGPSKAASAAQAAQGQGSGQGADQIQPQQTVVPPVFRQGIRIEDLHHLDVGTPSVAAKLYVAPDFKVSTSRTDAPYGSYNAAYDTKTDTPRLINSSSDPDYAANAPDPNSPKNDPALAKWQSWRERIDGTGGSDNIASTPVAPGGELMKIVHIEFKSFTELTKVTLATFNDLTAQGITIRFDPAQATKDATSNSWVLNTSSTTSSIDLKLYYTFFDDGTALPTNTIAYSGFPLQIVADGKVQALNFSVATTLTFGLRDVTSEADMSVASNPSLQVLPARGVGYDIDGQGGDDTIHAGVGHDSISGGAGADRLYGESGNDTLRGGSGGDLLDGGTGTNTASYSDATASVIVSLDAAAPATGGVGFSSSGGGVLVTGAAAGDADGDTLVSIRNIVGSAYADTLIGDSQSNLLSGGLGNDVLAGGGGAADTLDGGGGNNTASYQNATSRVVASLSSFTSVSPGGAVAAVGDAVGDVYVSINNLRGSAYDDLLIGDSGVNTLTGGGDATGNGDTLEGMGGADVLIGDAASTKDTASYAHATTAVTASLTNALVTATGDAAGDTYTSIENLVGSSLTGDNLIGDANANRIDGGNSGTTGGGGGDTLEGLGGADTLVGSAFVTDYDTASFEHSGSGLRAVLINQGGTASSSGYASTAAYIAARSLTGITGSGDAAGDVYTNIENLRGSAFADTLIGDDNINTITGGGGGDTLEGLGGGDSLTGAVGASDTASYEHSTGSVVASLASGLGNLFLSTDAFGDRYYSVENLLGSANADQLIGDGVANLITGNGGGDTLEGLAGADTLVGGAGTDAVSFEHSGTTQAWSSTDAATSTRATTASGAGVQVVLINQGGTDDHTGHPDKATYIAARGMTGLTGTNDAAGDVYTNIENIVGSAYHDTLIGDDNANTLTGGGGGDTLEGLGGADALVGTSGQTDTASYAHSTAGVTVALGGQEANAGGDAAGDTYTSIENIAGSAYADNLIGNTGDNAIAGGGGNDTLEGYTGADTLDGSAGGSVTASYLHASAGVLAMLDPTLFGLTKASATGDALNDVYVSIANLQGSNLRDTLIGNAAANTLLGAGGDDILEGYAGADSLDGGTGTNTASYEHSASGLSVSLVAAGGSITVGGRDWTGYAATGHAVGDVFANIQYLTGSAYADTLIGDDGNNSIVGNGGGDLFEGLAGNDTFVGAAGAVIDTVTYAHAVTGVGASLDATYSTVGSGDGDGDSYVNIDNLIGSGANDTLIGNSGANSLSGGDGNDTLEGLAGADTLDGGAGTNTASYEHSGSAVAVSLTSGTGTSGDANGDTLTNIRNLTGSSYADNLTGDTADNTLLGGSGDDTLEGRAGADRLDGGAGTNTASYANSASAISVSLAAGTGTAGDANGDTLLNIANLVGSANADSMTGDSGINVLLGGSGDDTIEGLAGTGGDTIEGGTGSNTAGYASSLNGVTVSLTDGALKIGGSTVSFASESYGGYSGVRQNTGSGDEYQDLLVRIQNLTGSNQADVLIGSSGANTLVGGGGNDTLEGLAGADSLDGGTGTNTASYENSASAVAVSLTTGTGTAGDANGDTLTNIRDLIGSANNDTLTGDVNANSIVGGAGNDTLEGRAGADTLDGGTGTNTASYENSASAVAVSLASGTGTAGDATGDTLSNIRNLIGSANNDTLVGDNNANSIVGGGGDDTLEGLAGADTFDGGTGTNTVSFASSTSAVVATLDGNYTALTTGDAVGDSYASISNLIGSDYDDKLIGSSSANTLTGGAGNDTLEGLAGADSLDGGTGTNTASYEHSTSAVAVSLAAGTGTAGDANGDTLINIRNLVGSNNNDTLTGDANANALAGGGGDDTLEGLAGADTFDGGTGTNTVTFANSTAAVVATLDSTYNGLTSGDAVGDSYTSIANLIGSGYNDQLIGNSAANTISGGDGNDTIEGLGGADSLVGGNGTNTASYEHAGSAVAVSLTTGTGTAGDANGDTLSGFQYLIGSAYDDTLTGDGNANSIVGGGGDDTLEGRAGSDTLDGGTGDNTASYANSTAAVSVSLLAATASGGDAAGDVLTNFVHLTGSAYNDTLSGDSNDNRISGGTGADSLMGNDGDDTIDSGVDTVVDTIDGGNGIADVLTYASLTSSVTLTLNTSTYATATIGGSASDQVRNIEWLIGSQSTDSLTGDSGMNTIDGGSGNDTIDGGTGTTSTANNSLVGGAGTDTLTYASMTTTAVTVSLAAGSATIGTTRTDTFNGFENLTGAQGNDSLTGDSGNNSIDGGTGNDTLIGGAGNDTLNGNTGTDYVSYQTLTSSGQGVTVDLTTNTATARTGADSGSDTLSGIENVIGSSYADSLLGNASANIFDPGNDLVVDTIDGGAGNDQLTYASLAYSISLTLNGATYATATINGSASDQVRNIEWLTGSQYADTLTGDSNANTIDGGIGTTVAASNTLDGGTGTDTLSYTSMTTGVTASLASATVTIGTRVDTISNFENLTGGSGNDTLAGNTGNNAIDGGAGTDYVTYAGVTSTGEGVTIRLDTNTAVARTGADSGTDTLANIENVTGSGYADSIVGSTAANTIYGGNGDDSIVSTTGGADSLMGEAGNDTFTVLNTAPYAKVDGGTGSEDSVIVSGLTAGGSFNLTTLTGLTAGTLNTSGSKITNVEVLNFAEATPIATTITVLKEDIRNITNTAAGSADLYIIHGSTDNIAIAASGTSQSAVTIGGVTYSTHVAYAFGSGETLHWLM